MAASALLSSASGILALLDETEHELKIHALNQLNDGLADYHYMEIARSLPTMYVVFPSFSLQPAYFSTGSLFGTC
jgi:hypothetical protein